MWRCKAVDHRGQDVILKWRYVLAQRNAIDSSPLLRVLLLAAIVAFFAWLRLARRELEIGFIIYFVILTLFYTISALLQVRDELRRHLRLHPLPLPTCPACGYELTGLPISAMDRCARCPECSASWRLKTADSSHPVDTSLPSKPDASV